MIKRDSAKCNNTLTTCISRLHYKRRGIIEILFIVTCNPTTCLPLTHCADYTISDMTHNHKVTVDKLPHAFQITVIYLPYINSVVSQKATSLCEHNVTNPLIHSCMKMK